VAAAFAALLVAEAALADAEASGAADEGVEAARAAVAAAHAACETAAEQQLATRAGKAAGGARDGDTSPVPHSRSITPLVCDRSRSLSRSLSPSAWHRKQ
jgi:hypothetical protein